MGNRPLPFPLGLRRFNHVVRPCQVRLNLNNTSSTGRRPMFLRRGGCVIGVWPGSGGGRQFRLEREHLFRRRNEMPSATAYDVGQVLAQS